MLAKDYMWSIGGQMSHFVQFVYNVYNAITLHIGKLRREARFYPILKTL